MLGHSLRYLADLVTVDDSTEDGVLTVEMWRGPIANEEGAAISVGTSIGHRKDTLMRVRHPHLLVGELSAVDALRLRTIVVHDNLAALHHEAGDDALEDASAVVQVPAKLACAEGAEVFNCTRQLILEKLHHDAALVIALLSLCSNLDVHKDLDVTEIEIWHFVVNGRVFVTVQTIVEKFLGGLALLFTLTQVCLVHFLLQVGPVLSDTFVGRLELIGLSAVSERLRKVSQMHVGHTAQVQSLC